MRTATFRTATFRIATFRIATFMLPPIWRQAGAGRMNLAVQPAGFLLAGSKIFFQANFRDVLSKVGYSNFI